VIEVVDGDFAAERAGQKLSQRTGRETTTSGKVQVDHHSGGRGGKEYAA
jgi:hypothetical protein